MFNGCQAAYLAGSVGAERLSVAHDVVCKQWKADCKLTYHDLVVWLKLAVNALRY